MSNEDANPVSQTWSSMKFLEKALFLTLILLTFAAMSEEVVVGESEIIGLTADKPFLHVIHEGRSVKVQRVQDPDYELRGYFAKTARKCPPFCIQPEKVDPAVATIGEVEVFDFMENQLRDGAGFLIDARTQEWFQRGTIPGSINIPFTDFKDASSPEMEKALLLFGAKRRVDVGAVSRKLEALGLMGDKNKTEKWDFTDCKALVIWCNGPACGQSPRAIKGLLKVGYPTDKIFYYRGGMQMWQLWGLTTVIPGE